MARAGTPPSIGSVEHFPSPNENITEEDDATHSVDKKEVGMKLEQLRKRTDSVKILVIGLTGAGKSSLVNAMMGDIVAQSQAGARACQTKVECHKGEYDGIRIKIYDTAGFGETGIPEKKILKNIAENTPRKGYDLILIAIRMDSRFDAENAKKMLLPLGKHMDQEMWKRSIVVLTFANFFVFQLKEGYPGCIKEEDIKLEVETKTQEFKEIFKEHTGKDKDLVSEIPFVLAGSSKERKLPTDDDWLITLWDQSIFRCRTEVKPFLKCIRFQRLFVDLCLIIQNIFPISKKDMTGQHVDKIQNVEQSRIKKEIPKGQCVPGQSIGEEQESIRNCNSQDGLGDLDLEFNFEHFC